MKVKELNGFVIFDSDGHGKTVKGNKKTTGMQVREYIQSGYILLKTVNYPVEDTEKRNKAIEACEKYIIEYTE